MSDRTKLRLWLALSCTLLLFVSWSATHPPRTLISMNSLPPVVLWAWERPEDLTFLDPERFGVAFLAQTLVLNGDEVVFRPRRQPLKVSPTTKLIAVTRVESSKTTRTRAALSDVQMEKLVSLIVKTQQLENVTAVQLDFDATKSERVFYRKLLEQLRVVLPKHVPLSMTALASFCLGDRWLDELPVDEVVPMIFRMGLDNEKIKSFLAAGNDFQEPLCRSSYGVALDEPVKVSFVPPRRLYVFNSKAWSAEDVSSLKARMD